MNQKIAVIGGSGVYNLEGVEFIKEHNINTPYGKPSAPVMEAKFKGAEFYFIPRHGRHHEFLPHEVNYCANIFALKSLGVKYIVSVSAVGSLKEELPPTHVVLPDQFIDWTKGLRRRTFFGDGIAAHVSTALPIELNLQKLFASACEKAGVAFTKGGSYICIEGPQFSSKAESAIYRSFGASIIGMTNVPESYLAKEAGIAYATLAMVTDYDCWKEEHCSVDEIMRVMKENNHSVHKVLAHLLPELAKNPPAFKAENTYAVMTPMEKLSSEQKHIVEVLLK